MKMKSKKFKNGQRGITLIALVITIIVLLILAGVSIATLTGENGILTQAETAKEETEIATEREAIQLAIINYNASNEEKYNIGEKLYDRTVANGDKWSIVMYNNIAYGTGWNYIGTGVELESYGQTTEEWLVNYEIGEIIRLEEGNFSKLKYGENLAVAEGLILNADPVNMSSGDSWGEGVTLYGVTEGDGYGWNGTELKLDGVNDYIEIYPSNELNIEKGLTFEYYAYLEDRIASQAMLAKTDSDPSQYSTNRFRTQFYNSTFYCSMSAKNSESSWGQDANPGYHWIKKFNIGSFTTETGGYLTMTANLENTTISLYWNGEFVGETTCSYDWMVGGKLTENTVPFTIGKMIANVSAGYVEQYSKVDLYACRLYNQVLSDEEIKQNYEKTVAYHNLLLQTNNE